MEPWFAATRTKRRPAQSLSERALEFGDACLHETESILKRSLFQEHRRWLQGKPESLEGKRVRCGFPTGSQLAPTLVDSLSPTVLTRHRKHYTNEQSLPFIVAAPKQGSGRMGDPIIWVFSQRVRVTIHELHTETEPVTKYRNRVPLEVKEHFSVKERSLNEPLCRVRKPSGL